jgi:hypothetical protein
LSTHSKLEHRLTSAKDASASADDYDDDDDNNNNNNNNHFLAVLVYLVAD